jgi:hypothetical protein
MRSTGREGDAVKMQELGDRWWRRAARTAIVVAGAVVAMGCAGTAAEGQLGPDAGQGPAMAMGSGRMVRGTVTAATADHLTVKTELGEIFQVVVTPNTQVRKGRDQVKLVDVHAGDGVGAMGEVDAEKKTVHALFVQVVDAEQVKRAREAMGKTMIAGTVTAIDDLKLTILRTDQVVQVIAVDEDTSFRRGGRNVQMMLGGNGSGMGTRAGRGGGAAGNGAGAGNGPQAEEGESLTLADVKVGSLVGGPGTLKNGVFVPTQLAVTEPGAMRQGRRRQDGTAPVAVPAEPK